MSTEKQRKVLASGSCGNKPPITKPQSCGIGRSRLSLFEHSHVDLAEEELKALEFGLREVGGRRVSQIQDVLSAEEAPL